MNFVKYSSIENSYRDKFIQKINDLIAKKYLEDDFVVTEKVHGANFSFWYDGKKLKTAKRSGFITDDENFYSSYIIEFKYTGNIKNLYNYLNLKFNINTLVIYGELYGGIYPNLKSSNPDTKKIQGDIFYNPNIDFYAFDIVVDGKYLNMDEVEMLCKAFSIFHAKILFRGTLEQCLKYPNNFNSLIPKWLNLPEIENNICEGVVIKPLKSYFFNNGERVIIKNKNDKWSEKDKKEKVQKQIIELSDDGNKLLYEALSYATENRLKNIISKYNNKITDKDFGQLLRLMNIDALDDFNKDFGVQVSKLPKNEIKIINKHLSSKNAEILRKNFLKIIDNF